MSNPKNLTPPPSPLVEQVVAEALIEDLGLAGDITTNAIFDEATRGTAQITAREAGVLAGQTFVTETFLQTEPESEITWHIEDGGELKPGDKIATIKASVRTILTAERTALNFLGALSGIASHTAKFVTEIKGTKAKIVDTRKTTPGLRFAQKYAVRAGGGENHRFRLDDAILIKDNHIAFAGSISQAVQKARAATGHMVKLEIEVDTIEQLKQALTQNIDVVLLDNMSLEQLKQAVSLINSNSSSSGSGNENSSNKNGKVIAEASGGVNLTTVRAIAQTGVDIISVGALTHSSPCLDLGLDIAISNT